MTVRQILKLKGREVFCISPFATMLEALTEMARHDVGALLVRDEDGAIHGIVSERDYARKVILRGRSSRDLPVAEVMNKTVHTVGPSENVEACMTKMTERRTRHLPVLENAELVGLISMGDVVRGVIEDQRGEIQQLEGYILGHP